MFKYQSIVPIKGFSWRDDFALLPELEGPGSDSTGPFLVSVGDRARIIYPLEDYPTLFESFAKLNEGPKEELASRISAFANKYGQLGLIPTLDNVPVYRGEGLNVWEREIADMAVAFRLWRCVKNGWMPKLASSIHWDKDRVGLTWNEMPRFNGFLDLFKEIEKKPEEPNRYRIVSPGEAVVFLRGDLVGPANYFLQGLINEKIKGHVSPLILRDQEYNLHPFYLPDNLLYAMWFQLFQAVTGITDFIQCEICGDLIALSQHSRSNKIVHTRCAKNRSDRKRKAKTLFKEGMSVEKIAHQIGEKTETVAEWLEEGK